MPQTAQAPTTGAASPAQVNRAQRMAVLQQAIEMKQEVFGPGAVALSTVGATNINIAPRFVGLTKRFQIKVTGTVNNTDAANTLNLTDFGMWNILTQLGFTDLNNNQRVLTEGKHLAALKSMKHRQVAEAALLSTALNDGANVGNNFGVCVAPTAIAHGTSAPFTFYFDLPLAYSDEDLRGAIYLGVVNATATISLVLNNNNAIVAAGVDSTDSVWHGAAGNISGVSIQVNQIYLDQLPRNKNGQPVLPVLDLSTVYELKSTNFTGIVANQDFPIPYANFRDFVSTFLIYNHDGSGDAGRVGGTDISYVALQSANFTNIMKLDPISVARTAREILKADLPPGMYYFGHRYPQQPISTTTYGNMQLILNALTATANGYIRAYWEDFALVNTLTGGLPGSLAAS